MCTTNENHIICLKNGEITSIPMIQSIGAKKSINLNMLRLAKQLSI